eukprot:UN18502
MRKVELQSYKDNKYREKTKLKTQYSFTDHLAILKYFHICLRIFQHQFLSQKLEDLRKKLCIIFKTILIQHFMSVQLHLWFLR